MKQGVNWIGVLRGSGTGLAVMAVLCAAGAAMMQQEVIGTDRIGLLAAGILTAAAFSGGMVCPGGWQAMASGAGLWGSLMLTGVCMDGVSSAGAGHTMLVILGGSGAAALIKCRSGKSGQNHRKSRIVKVNKKLHHFRIGK